MRFIRRSLHCSAGGGAVSNLTKTQNVTIKIKCKRPLHLLFLSPNGRGELGGNITLLPSIPRGYSGQNPPRLAILNAPFCHPKLVYPGRVSGFPT